MTDNFEKRITEIRARIDSLRSQLSRSIEPIEAVEIPKEVVVETPSEEKQKIKHVELDQLKAKLLGRKT
jgi:hypothetical protein